MAFDSVLAERMRAILAEHSGVAEKKMFGGLAFLLEGKLACGIIKDSLIVRVGKQRADEALQRQEAKPFDLTGRAMKGWLLIPPETCSDESSLERWISSSLEFVAALPPS